MGGSDRQRGVPKFHKYAQNLKPPRAGKAASLSLYNFVLFPPLQSRFRHLTFCLIAAGKRAQG